jgi:hypothetical protein
LDSFAGAIPEGSQLFSLSLAGNKLTGSLGGLQRLGVFLQFDLAHTPAGSPVPTGGNLLNVSYNQLEGMLVPSYYAAPSAGGPKELPRLTVRPCMHAEHARRGCMVTRAHVQIDIRGNALMVCPEAQDTNQQVEVLCDGASAEAGLDAGAQAQQAAGEDAGGRGTQPLSRGAVIGLSLALTVVAMLAAAAGAFLWRRREAKRSAEGRFVRYDDSAPAAAPDAPALPAL